MTREASGGVTSRLDGIEGEAQKSREWGNQGSNHKIMDTREGAHT